MEMMLINWFIRGLPPKFRAVLAANEVNTLDKAIVVANIMKISSLTKKEEKKEEIQEAR